MVDWTNWNIYIYPAIVVGSIVVIVFSVKLILLFRKRRSLPLTEKELKDELKQLKIDEKQELMKIKEKKVITVKLKPSKVAVPEEELKTFDFKPKGKLKIFTLAFWKNWVKQKYFPAKIVMINMELVNGFHRTFLVIEKDGGFEFRDKKYIFDDDSKYYNMDAKLYMFDYHENIALPIKRKIPVTAIKKTIESTDDIDIEYAINPSTLQRFMTAKIAEGVMKGTMLDEFLRKLQMFIIVIMVAVLVHLALFIYGSGMLQNIQVPSF